jgi:hypothetical protein
MNIADWINVVVEPQLVTELMNLRFYRAYNGASDPAWKYTVAVDTKGVVHRLGGFDATEYPTLVKQYLSAATTKQQALEIVNGYFAFVENWEPGVIRSLPPIVGGARQVCVSSAPAKTSSVTKTANGFIVTTLLFDSASGGLECVAVELSGREGLQVISRTTFVDRRKIVM